MIKPKKINIYEKVISMKNHKKNYGSTLGDFGEQRLSRYYYNPDNSIDEFYRNEIASKSCIEVIPTN